MKPAVGKDHSLRGSVYCLICTHTVEADMISSGRRLSVRRGQKCPRCSSSLDAACIVMQNRAA
jgi:DNA-directed RNA polymerase subunit RPC12/RpoP